MVGSDHGGEQDCGEAVVGKKTSFFFLVKLYGIKRAALAYIEYVLPLLKKKQDVPGR